MMAIILWLRSILCRFRCASEGVAAVEFALILPVMLMAYIGTMEASALLSMDKRVQTITGTVGDLVARANKEITMAQLTNYFQAADGIMLPFSTDELTQTVTAVYVNSHGDTEIEWSQSYHDEVNQVAYRKGDPYALPAAITNIARNAYVIVSEAAYSYTPLLGIVYDTAIPLYSENYYLPRFGGDIELKQN